MNKSLYTKFLLAYLVFGIMSFIIISTIASEYTMKELTTIRAEDLYKEASLLSSKYGSAYFKNQSTVESVQTNLSAIATSISADIWIVDPAGRLLISSEGTIANDEQVILTSFDPTLSGSRYYQIGNFYDLYSEDVLTVYSPITSNFRVRGYVLIHTPMSGLVEYRDKVLNISYMSLLVIFIMSLIILGVFTWIVYIPLKKITLAANEYAKGNLKYALNVTSEDEIGHLAASLNYMSSELSKSEEYQKKFISNISHDFRSPLTSIKGYLEAILDGTIPPEMQEKYLNIVLFETERLNKLTSSLLTLNNFDINKNLLDIVDFDINSIIKSTAAAFEGTCRGKKISINLTFASKDMYVSADVGKIQQVLYNLLDNAIKFSHNNSTIYVETTEKNEKIFVSVKDTGIGIPKDSLKKIWERFYKTDLSRGKDKRGTGLGLSIVKEIIQSHGEHINVISTEGVGTEFIFTLPKSKK
ncbi:sensor histidine kinase [Anaerobium acetethylicum]|uniref:histidine kinase n=1 Tax=Anaerobium acetethylicum TaxID=1619234 RepID=A0A1D3TX49_9FIRM|nr:HAMP domain-containing sensor histidine kinase [Anaerobium acetethylicum]SCP98881.1 Signal transduction histidine kinase [Anaerobium acetethylicum]